MTNDTAPTCTHCKCALIFDSRSPTCERWVCSCGYFVMRAITQPTVVNTPAGPIRMTADPTPIPGIEQRCARCDVQIDDLAAHQSKCLAVGDWVRWEYHGHWSEGELRCHQPDGVASVRVETGSQYRDVGRTTSMLVANLRRIPRPGQEVVKINTPVGVLTLKADPTLQPGEFRFEPHAPTLYDGLTAEQCLQRFIWLQRDKKDTPLAGTHRRDALTESQRNIARFLWSTQLAAKVAASRSERHQVVLEQDAEDFEW